MCLLPYRLPRDTGNIVEGETGSAHACSPFIETADAYCLSFGKLAFSCNALVRFVALLMRYSGSLVPGSCLVTSKTPPGTFRLTAGLSATTSPTLNLWGGIGSSRLFEADNRWMPNLNLNRGDSDRAPAGAPAVLSCRLATDGGTSWAGASDCEHNNSRPPCGSAPERDG